MTTIWVIWNLMFPWALQVQNTRGHLDIRIWRSWMRAKLVGIHI